MFAMIVDGYGKTTFSKGHVRRAETLCQAAERETCEEIGVCDLRLVARLGKIDIWFKDRFVHKGTLVHKFIHYFLFEAPSNARIRIPPPRKQGERIKQGLWVPADQVLDRSSYQDLEPIIKRALRILKV